jgi:hypothetical protein
MRTSVTLDEDVYQLAYLYAHGRGITLGAAIGDLIRKATETPKTKKISPNLMTAPNGMLMFAPRGRVITPEMVKEALEDD